MKNLSYCDCGNVRDKSEKACESCKKLNKNREFKIVIGKKLGQKKANGKGIHFKTKDKIKWE